MAQHTKLSLIEWWLSIAHKQGVSVFWKVPVHLRRSFHGHRADGWKAGVSSCSACGSIEAGGTASCDCGGGGAFGWFVLPPPFSPGSRHGPRRCVIVVGGRTPPTPPF